MRHIILAVVTFCSTCFSHAGISLDATRIIFPSHSTSVVVQLRNNLDSPSLVQAWIDNGDMNEMPKADDIPFLINPPLGRVEAKQGQALRIIHTGSPQLATDRESLFWFNVLDIAPEDPTLTDQNLLSFTVRTRIKLFYRPDKLNMSVKDAYQNLQFKYDQVTKKIQVKNISPYYITLVNFIFKSTGKEYTHTEAIMLAPFSDQIINNFEVTTQPLQVTYSLINDFGGEQKLSKHFL